MVDIEVSIDAGDRYDPLGKSGLADMTAGLMKYGVRSNKAPLNEAQIADEIADLGASIGLSVGESAPFCVFVRLAEKICVTALFSWLLQ